MLLKSFSHRLLRTRATQTFLSNKYYYSIMSTMKAVYIDEQGGVEKLIYGEQPYPKLTEKSIIVKNHYAGLNFIDTYQRGGLYKVNVPGFILGREGAGEVVDVGAQVKDVKVGDRIAYINDFSYAEYTDVSSGSYHKLNDDISFEVGAALGLQGLTALTMIRDAYAVKKGDVILVHAAAGGVGLLLVQLLHHLGATVIGTVGSDEKAKLAKEHGADHTIVYTREDIVERVNEITNGQGCHAVLDGVGKDTFDASIASTRRLGTLVSFGNASGAVPPVNIFTLTPKNLKLMRPGLFGYLTTPEESHKWWSELLDLYSSKAFKIKIHKVYNLEDIKQAHIDIESRKTTGKLVIKI